MPSRSQFAECSVKPSHAAGLTAAGLDLWSGSTLADAEAAWTVLEREGFGTPFQRLDWVAAWFASVRTPASTPLILAIMDGSRVLAILPLERLRRGPAIVARVPGGRHCNLAAPIMLPGSWLSPAQWADALRRTAALHGIDLYDLPSQPLRLGPEENPLVAMPSALLRRDSMAVLDLAASPGHSLQSRRKLRQKRRWLQGLGHVAYRRATCAGGVDHVLDAFSRQKAHRFAELGIPDPFACREALRFLQTAALAGLDHGTPALELHWLDLDGRPIAIFGGAANGERLSGMILSFSSDRAVARCSPGRLLLDDVASDAARRGYRTLDLGPEEMRYKREICGRTEPLAHVVLPVTAVGRAAAQALVLARRSKRAIKRHPRLFRTINALRRLR